MRLLIIGLLHPHMMAAGKIALSRGARVSHVETIAAGLESLRSGKGADLILVDVTFSVKELLQHLKQERFNIPVVAGGINVAATSAVQAIKDGAAEFIPLPPDPELIAAVLESVSHDNDALLYQDPVMADVLKLATQIAPSDASILITGESGTGKEVMARHVHRKSKRSQKNFISINCAAIPENLLESELFGHEKGAFTGAIARRLGKFEEAHGGTLLLDEISEMHPRLQAKLLRAIQEREIDRVGGSSPVKVDIRLIATSNRDLQAEVKAGNFREDLFFRLNVVNLKLPSLRERPKDVVLLAEHFARKYAKLNHLPERPLSAALRDALMAYPWPGNVRELENTMHRAVLLASGSEISADAMMLPPTQPTSLDLDPTPPEADAPPLAKVVGEGSIQIPPALIGRTVAEVERDLILRTLDYYHGNRTHAATILGISIRTLRNKLRLYAQEVEG